MMNQETYVNIKGVGEQSWMIKEIAAETGFHRATVSKQLEAGAAAGVLRLATTSPEPTSRIGGGLDVGAVDLAQRYPLVADRPEARA